MSYYINGSVRKDSIWERFWSKVDIAGEDDCWPWKASKRNGYGQFTLGKDENRIPAHRMSYLLSVGDVLDGLLVCHKCDNRPCCNPSHLFVGTDLDNVRDMISKGRRRRRNKLSQDDIPEIFKMGSLGIAHWKIAGHFKVSRTAITRILLRQLWRGVVV